MSDSTRNAGALAAYTGARPEVQALVPRSARHILDLGCAAGALGAALKERQDAHVVGVEIDPALAAEARERLDRVVVADVERALASRSLGGGFGCVVAADVLEHLRDPWTALRLAAELLEPGGTVVVSLPNVRFFETFWQLYVRGTWPRRPQGIFDATHLRWFTLRDARDLLEGAGLTVRAIRPQIRIRPGGSRFDRLFAPLARTPLRELLAFQYVLLGSRDRDDGSILNP
jgi:SAM-dependent methyltransferase